MNVEQLTEVELLAWCYAVAAIVLSLAVVSIVTVKGVLFDRR